MTDPTHRGRDGDRGAGRDRAPKQDRSRATRDALLSATIALLAERGWAATTVGAVAAEAGVSRGAAQHHFPTREDLITAALEHMFVVRVAELRATTEAALPPAGRDRVRHVVAMVAEQFTSELFTAAVQVWTAAAADEALRERVQPLEYRFSRDAYELMVRLLGADTSDPTTRRLLRATLDFARGLGLADLLSDDSARRRSVTDAWADVVAGTMRTTGAGP